ncbi:hypothetical protein TNCT_336171 [Trichonephila clavata]|uniref:Uncharacterized protein n=1 Tax=Trichonephila clavata TaxID=2740835 RepID=A0A8X6IXJ1_TRICU|nr:hypothetical protein TNCT_336171 [Trichonephila clavata]
MVASGWGEGDRGRLRRPHRLCGCAEVWERRLDQKRCRLCVFVLGVWAYHLDRWCSLGSVGCPLVLGGFLEVGLNQGCAYLRNRATRRCAI